jgi:hypothetical protein
MPDTRQLKVELNINTILTALALAGIISGVSLLYNLDLRVQKIEMILQFNKISPVEKTKL